MNEDGAEVVIFESTLSADAFEGARVMSNLEEFKSMAEGIVANHMEPATEDVQDKKYTRELYFID